MANRSKYSAEVQAVADLEVGASVALSLDGAKINGLRNAILNYGWNSRKQFQTESDRATWTLTVKRVS